MAAKNKKNVEEVPVATVVEETGNLSKKHRDDLIGKIGAIRDFLRQSADTNATQLLAFAADLEKEVRTKKYGLVFEEHKERVDVELEKKLPVLTENKKRFIDNGGELNFLIEGDNLAALKLLEKTHKGKIDVIYIDPPYNTGNEDFIYNDLYVDATDTFRHSKWLSFMKKRLELARWLLRKEGLIFISIDDREQADLKILCDQIFGDENFVCQICVKMSEATGVKMTHAKVRIPKVKEYVLLYSRSGIVKIKPPRVPKEKWDDEYKLFCKGITEEDVSYLKAARDDEERTKTDLEKCDQIMAKMKFVSLNSMLNELGISKEEDIEKFKIENAWRIVRTVAMSGGGKAIADEKKKRCGNIPFVIQTRERKLYFIKGDYDSDVAQPRIKLLFADDYLTYNPCDFWSDIKTTGLEAEGEVSFTNGKKPLKLIERIIEMNVKSDLRVLDFFAGSGTTGHAVMSLNKKDGGARKFILVTSNENEICEKITYVRLSRMIAKEGYKARLKYFKIDYVPIEEKVYLEYADDLLKYIRELVELENGVDFAHDKTTVIVLTDKELEKFAADEDALKACKSVYVGHNILIGSRIRRKIESKGIQIRTIPQYYYSEEGV